MQWVVWFYCTCLRSIDVQSTNSGSGERFFHDSFHFTPYSTCNLIPCIILFQIPLHFSFVKIQRINAVKWIWSACVKLQAISSDLLHLSLYFRKSRKRHDKKMDTQNKHYFHNITDTLFILLSKKMCHSWLCTALKLCQTSTCICVQFTSSRFYPR